MTDAEMEAAFTRATGWTKTFNSLAFKIFCLGAEIEREACAKVCEARFEELKNDESGETYYYLDELEDAAKVIRERSNG